MSDKPKLQIWDKFPESDLPVRVMLFDHGHLIGNQRIDSPNGCVIRDVVKKLASERSFVLPNDSLYVMDDSDLKSARLLVVQVMTTQEVDDSQKPVRGTVTVQAVSI